MRNAVNLNGVGVLHRQAENDHSSDPETAVKGGRQAEQARKMDWFVKNVWYGGVVRCDGVRTKRSVFLFFAVRWMC